LGAKRPSLNALRALEATVRLSSMTAAAEELSVTHGAVSRHIKSLEEMFGIPLLLRGARSVQATPEGGRLATELSRAFALIASSVEQLQPGPLTLSCSSTIMMSWLIPRIGGFHELYPDIELRFNMNYDRIDFVRDEISVAIRGSMIEPPKEVIIKEMIDEWIGPVCSPDYAAKTFKTLDDLDGCVLLATKTLRAFLSFDPSRRVRAWCRHGAEDSRVGRSAFRQACRTTRLHSRSVQDCPLDCPAPACSARNESPGRLANKGVPQAGHAGRHSGGCSDSSSARRGKVKAIVSLAGYPTLVPTMRGLNSAQRIE